MIGKLDKVRGTALGGSLRSVGRVALWAVVVLLLVRGVGAVATDGGSAETPPPSGRAGTADLAVAAFAVRYARAYLADNSPGQLAGLLAPGVSVPHGGGPAPQSSHVAQAEATGIQRTGPSGEVVTVAAELRNGHVAILAVPIVRDQAGKVAASGAPAFVSAPGIGRVENEAEGSQPIPGVDAKEIAELARRFTTAYLTTADAAELRYLTPPASDISPVGGFTPVGTVTVRQLGDSTGPRRTVLATVRAETASGAIYPITYHLTLTKRERWYVASVRGEDQ